MGSARRSSRPAQRSRRPIAEELQLLLAARGLSLRGFAEQIGLDVSYLSKALRTVGGKRPTVGLVEQVAAALDLPADYFLEYRQAKVAEHLAERLRGDARFVDREYERLPKP